MQLYYAESELNEWKTDMASYQSNRIRHKSVDTPFIITGLDYKTKEREFNPVL